MLGNVRANRDDLRDMLHGLRDIPIVGDVRGEGFFYGIELVKDKDTRATFDDDESERLLRGYLSKALFDAGLYCRADDRGDPVVQLAPPLIIGQPEFDFIEQTLRAVLTIHNSSFVIHYSVLHASSVLPAHLIQRMRYLPEGANLYGFHQLGKKISVGSSHLL